MAYGELQVQEREESQVYETAEYDFENEWEEYIRRYDAGWRVHERKIVLTGANATLCVVWTKGRTR